MIKFSCAFTLLLAFSFSLQASNIPPRPNNGREYISHARVFKKWQDWQGQAEIALSDRKFRAGTRKTQVGLRYQITTHEKIGLHLSAQTGLRHNTDWIPRATNPSLFTWRQTKDRLEGIGILEAQTKRWLGRTGLAWDARLRWLYFEHNQFQSLQAKLGLLWPRKGVSPGLNTEFSFPLNYGDTGLDEFWAYGLAIIDITPRLKQILKVGPGFYRWTRPEVLGAATYHTVYPNIRFEIDFNYYFQ
jgi:hypothetical protein